MSGKMNVCIPVNEGNGLKSEVCGHFGSAPMFMIVDTEMGTCRAVDNRNLHHSHGACQPLAALAGERVEAFIVAGIGMGALDRLQAAGISVFLCKPTTAEEVVAELRAGTLSPVSPETACGHHGSGSPDACGRRQQR